VNPHSIFTRAVEAFRTHWRLFLVTFLLVWVGSIVMAYVASARFESTARLLVKLEQRGVSLSQAESRHDLALNVAEEAVATQAEVLASRDIVARLVDRLGVSTFDAKGGEDSLMARVRSMARAAQAGLAEALESAGLITRMSPRDATIREIQRGLRIFPVRRAQVIQVSFRAKDPELAPLIVRTLIDLHLQKLAEIQAYSDDYDFYKQQTTQFREQLSAAEAQLAAFKEQHGIVDLQAEKTMLMQRIDQLTSVLDGVGHGGAQQVTQPADTQERGLLTESRAADTTLGGDVLVPLAARLNGLRLERAHRLSLYAVDHSSVQQIENQIASTESLLTKEVRRVVDTLNTYKARLRKIERLEPEFSRYLRNSRISEENYKTYSKAAEDRRLAQERQNRVIVMVVDEASIPDAPVTPSRLSIVLAGLVGGLLLACAAVLLRQWLAIRFAPSSP
jgi:uncharacterized protein involved in exopolysaccharide biosynthesis